MRFPPELLDEIRARLSVSQIVARKVAIKKRGREHVGLSPFKTEKTPSFYVNDQKGFYHCFASGEHGDIFTFLMKTEGLTFPEAVERLAADAGVTLPAPQARDDNGPRPDQRQRLQACLEASNAFFARSFAGPGGAPARRYVLESRGLTAETVALFEIGYAPNSRSALREQLARDGFTVDEMVTAGLLIAGDDIPVAYDRFRHRVMFPIRDTQGRLVAFGGRALDADAPAKYLNSPETPLFHKGALLFNAFRARKAAHDKGRIIAVEGYMDVIALSQAGFPEAVAPLGTALTEAQAGLLWRLADEPILCFDGDSAGRKAAFRAIDTALPLLKPGASLRFAFLPDGEDPDDLVRGAGPAAFANVLERTRPLADVLFEREWQVGEWTTPERRAWLETSLKALVGRIQDASVRGHYERDMRGRLWQAFNARPARMLPNHGSHRLGLRPPQTGGWQKNRERRGNGGGIEPVAHAKASDPLRSSRLATNVGTEPPHREALLLATLLNHPDLLGEDSEVIAALPLASPGFGRLRDAMLSLHAVDNSLDSASLRTQLTSGGLAKEVALADKAIAHRGDSFALPEATVETVAAGWSHMLALHERQTGLHGALSAEVRNWDETGSEASAEAIAGIKRELLVLADAERPSAQAPGSPAAAGRTLDG